MLYKVIILVLFMLYKVFNKELVGCIGMFVFYHINYIYCYYKVNGKVIL
jgi:hypothetical protein